MRDITLPNKDVDIYRLESDSTIIIPPLSVGRIPHDIILHAPNGRVFMYPEPDVFGILQLLIPCRPVDSGEVITYLFNISNKRVKIHRGDIISRLVAL